MMCPLNRLLRFFAALFIVLGPLVALAGILGAEWFFIATLAAAGIGVVALFVYSYLVYRRDPDRVTPAGTSPG